MDAKKFLNMLIGLYEDQEKIKIKYDIKKI